MSIYVKPLTISYDAITIRNSKEIPDGVDVCFRLRGSIMVTQGVSNIRFESVRELNINNIDGVVTLIQT